MLQLKELTKVYPGGCVAVDDASLHLPAATASAIVGGNGVGKSTLLRCAARLLMPTRGSVEWGEGNVAYLGEADYLYGSATVAENLETASQLCGSARGSASQIAQQWDVAGWWDLRVDQLSRGQRQRVALARAWLVGRGLLLLDEPLVGLDQAGIDTFRAAVQQMIRDGGSVCIALQSPEPISDICTKQWQMTAGRLHA